MWVMPACEFVLLPEWYPHQLMIEQGQIVKYDETMENVFFMSHQWSSFEHPDPTLEQLRTIQRLLLRMLQGDVQETSPTFESANYLPAELRITAHRWSEIVRQAYIWIDYIAVPQIGQYHDGEEPHELMMAVNSIPAYVERCSHFFAVTPTVQHLNVKDMTCDYGSWLRRGWCRVEMFSLLLERFNDLPVIVVKGGEASPYMIAGHATLARPPGCGEFTCCTRNHLRKMENGTVRAMTCDKVKITPLIWKMLHVRIQHLLSIGQLDEFRIWAALVPLFMRGLPAKDYIANYLPETIPEFLRIFHFQTPLDEEGPNGSGFSPLMLAVASGNLKVAGELISLHKADVHCVLRLRQMRMAYRIFGFPDDSSVLHAAVSVCPSNHDEMVALLVMNNADPNRRTRTGFGFTPLMAAVAMDNLCGVKSLVKLPRIDLERGLRTNSATALGCAAYLSTFEVVEVLVAAGASRTHLNDHGGSKLTDACQNPAADKRMLDLLWQNGELDVNYVFKPRNMKWYLIDRYFEAALKYSLIPKSDIVMGMAHTRGSTPLHLASMFGHLEQVQWLLSHGGMASLQVRNNMGCTPMDVARIFGRHAEVEALLGASMMNLTFRLQGERMRGIPSGRRATSFGRDQDSNPSNALAPTYMFQSTPRYMFQSTPLASSVLASSIIGTLSHNCARNSGPYIRNTQVTLPCCCCR